MYASGCINRIQKNRLFFDQFCEIKGNNVMDTLEQTNTFQTQVRGSNSDEYEIYLAFADDGQGGDLTAGGAPLKTYDEWLNS